MSEPALIPLYYADTGTIRHDKRVSKIDEEWIDQLGREVFEIARKAGTEPAFSGAFYATKTAGLYRCICCGTDLFSSVDKFDSGTGWPSFGNPISQLNIRTKQDISAGMERTEVLCARCNAHLGHVFDDGPKPTGKRFCINAVSLDFKKEGEAGKETEK